MIPFLLSIVGGYLIGDSINATPKMANGGMYPSKLMQNDRVTLSIKGREVEVFDIKEYIENNFYYKPSYYPNTLTEYNFNEVEFGDAKHIKDWVKKEYSNVIFSISYKGKEYEKQN